MSSLPHGGFALAAAISAPSESRSAFRCCPAAARSRAPPMARCGSSWTWSSGIALRLPHRGVVAAHQGGEAVVLEKIRRGRPGRQIAGHQFLDPLADTLRSHLDRTGDLPRERVRIEITVDPRVEIEIEQVPARPDGGAHV